jgi:FixJ family two-component response regulator
MENGVSRVVGALPGPTHRQHEIPIVFLTAPGDETIRPRLLKLECLFKPFSETALLEALKAALGAS